MSQYHGKYILELDRDARPRNEYWHAIVIANSREEIVATRQVRGGPQRISKSGVKGDGVGQHKVTDAEGGAELEGTIYHLRAAP